MDIPFTETLTKQLIRIQAGSDWNLGVFFPQNELVGVNWLAVVLKQDSLTSLIMNQNDIL